MAKIIHDVSAGTVETVELTADELAARDAVRQEVEAAEAIRTAEEAARAEARAAVVAAAADALLTQIAAGVAANQSDRDNLDSVTTMAAVRVALGRMLNREAAMMAALEKIVKYLKASA